MAAVVFHFLEFYIYYIRNVNKHREMLVNIFFFVSHLKKRKKIVKKITKRDKKKNCQKLSKILKSY